MESIKNRTSIRKYADREISEELLNSLLQEAERTPTMGNLQLYSVVVTRSEEGKKALAPAHFNQPMVTQAPVVLTICADYRRTTAWANHRKAHPGYDNILSFMNAATDALLFTQTFTVLAEAAGLGTCFLGTTVYMPQMIIDTLHLPQLVLPPLPLDGPTKSLHRPTVCHCVPSYTAKPSTTIPPRRLMTSMPRKKHSKRTRSLFAPTR